MKGLALDFTKGYEQYLRCFICNIIYIWRIRGTQGVPFNLIIIKAEIELCSRGTLEDTSRSETY